MSETTIIRPSVFNVWTKLKQPHFLSGPLKVSDSDYHRGTEGMIVESAYSRLSGDIGRQLSAVCFGYCDVSDMAEYARNELRDLGLLVEGRVPSTVVEIVRNNFYVTSDE